MNLTITRCDIVPEWSVIRRDGQIVGYCHGLPTAHDFYWWDGPRMRPVERIEKPANARAAK